MDSVKNYYNSYNYPDLKFYTNKQIKNHKKLVSKILSYANLSLNTIMSKNILDAGCGTGEKSVLFAKHGAHVTSIDFSEGQLEKAKLLAKNNNVNINFKQMDIINSNLEQLGKFHIIICTGVLHHTENPYLGFTKLIDLLDKDGIIILGFYHKYSRQKYRFNRFLIKTFVSKDPDKIINWLTTSNFARIFRTAPLTTLYDRYAVPYESYHTLKEIKKWFRINNLQLIGYSENVKGLEIFKIFEKKTIFFVAGKRS